MCDAMEAHCSDLVAVFKSPHAPPLPRRGERGVDELDLLMHSMAPGDVGTATLCLRACPCYAHPVNGRAGCLNAETKVGEVVAMYGRLPLLARVRTYVKWYLHAYFVVLHLHVPGSTASSL